MPTRWRSPPPTPTGGRRCGWCCSRATARDGFVFYTNAESRKGGELAANPHAALLFHWKSLRRQVRIEGRGEPVDRRPRPTPISPAAAAIRSSAPGPRTSRARSTSARPVSRRASSGCARDFDGRDVPRPPHWYGLSRWPRERIEFWQRPRRTGCTSAACSPAPRAAAGPKACSTHERRPRDRAALTRAPRSPASRWRCSCSCSRPMPPGDRLGRDARQPRRYRARPDRQPGHAVRRAGRRACRRTATTASATARPRRSRRCSRSALIVDLGARHRLARGRAADRTAARTAAGRRGHRRLASIAIVATLALLAYQRSVIRRTGIGRDPHRQRPLPVGPAAQPGGDRRAGARPICAASPAPIRCSASPSPLWLVWGAWRASTHARSTS